MNSRRIAPHESRNYPPTSRRALVLLGLGMFALAPTLASAAERTWNGGASPDGTWTNAANWDAAVNAADSLLFAGSSNLDTENDFAAGTIFNGITFGATAGAFTLEGNALQLNGNVVNDSSALQTITAGLTISSGRTFNTGLGGLSVASISSTTTNLNLTKEGAGILTFTSGVGAFSGRAIINAGTVVLAGESTGQIFNSTITINGGMLQLAGTGGDQLGNNAALIMSAGSTFDLNGRSENIRSLNGSGTVTNNMASTTSTLSLNQNASSTFGGLIEDGAGVTAVALDNNVNSPKTFTGNNTYSGGTSLGETTLALGSDTAIGTGTLTITKSGVVRSNTESARTLTNAVTLSANSTFGSSSTGNLSFGKATTTKSVQVNVSNAQTTFTGLSGIGQFDKRGTGVLIISDVVASDFTGNIVVTTGTLTLDADLSSATGTNIVEAGAMLSGAGTLGGNVTLRGNIAAGNSTGTFTIGNNLSMTGTASAYFEINGALDYDRIVLGGGLTYGGELVLDFGYVPTLGTQYNLFDFTTQSGAFAGISFVDAGYDGTFDNTTGVLTVTAVPEPSAGVALALSALLCLTLTRRRNTFCPKFNLGA